MADIRREGWPRRSVRQCRPRPQGAYTRGGYRKDTRCCRRSGERADASSQEGLFNFEDFLTSATKSSSMPILDTLRRKIVTETSCVADVLKTSFRAPLIGPTAVAIPKFAFSSSSTSGGEFGYYGGRCIYSFLYTLLYHHASHRKRMRWPFNVACIKKKLQ